MFGVQLQVSTFLNRRKEFGKGILDEVLYVVLQSVVTNRDKTHLIPDKRSLNAISNFYRFDIISYINPVKNNDGEVSKTITKGNSFFESWIMP